MSAVSFGIFGSRNLKSGFVLSSYITLGCREMLLFDNSSFLLDFRVPLFSACERLPLGFLSGECPLFPYRWCVLWSSVLASSSSGWSSRYCSASRWSARYSVARVKNFIFAADSSLVRWAIIPHFTFSSYRFFSSSRHFSSFSYLRFRFNSFSCWTVISPTGVCKSDLFGDCYSIAESFFKFGASSSELANFCDDL